MLEPIRVVAGVGPALMCCSTQERHRLDGLEALVVATRVVMQVEPDVLDRTLVAWPCVRARAAGPYPRRLNRRDRWRGSIPAGPAVPSGWRASFPVAGSRLRDQSIRQLACRGG